MKREKKDKRKNVKKGKKQIGKKRGRGKDKQRLEIKRRST